MWNGEVGDKMMSPAKNIYMVINWLLEISDAILVNQEAYYVAT
jgi:hypothetical protein